MADLEEQLARSHAAEQAALDRVRAAQRASPRRQFGNTQFGNPPSTKAAEVTDRLYRQAPKKHNTFKKTAAAPPKASNHGPGTHSLQSGKEAKQVLYVPNSRPRGAAETADKKDQSDEEQAKINRQAVKKASKNAQRAQPTSYLHWHEAGPKAKRWAILIF